MVWGLAHQWLVGAPICVVLAAAASSVTEAECGEQATRRGHKEDLGADYDGEGGFTRSLLLGVGSHLT